MVPLLTLVLLQGVCSLPQGLTDRGASVSPQETLQLPRFPFCASPGFTADLDDVKFLLYTRAGDGKLEQLFADSVASVANSSLDVTLPTVVLIHGYLNQYSSSFVQDSMTRLLGRAAVNVVAVDWSSLACTPLYTSAAAWVPGVGGRAAAMLQTLVRAGVPSQALWLVGHSLGAHVAGAAARSFEHTLPRITGLDPALPGFEGAGADGRLDKTDALFVDCIHTCGGELGIMEPICHADYYPNGGRNYQPGCPWYDPAGICSHGRSHDYFAESVMEGHLFESCPWTVEADPPPWPCPNPALMGYPASPQRQGVFFLWTEGSFPFCRQT